MAYVYLPVESLNGESSAKRTCDINREVWSLSRPDSVKSQDDVSEYYFATCYNPTTDEWAIVADMDEQVKIHPDVDLTTLLSILPGVSQEEKDQLSAYVNANRGGSVPFWTLIPSSSRQVTEQDAQIEGWDPSLDEVITDYI
jgi:hypothetical protein